MDQGIIQSLKLKYRKRQLQYVLGQMDVHPTKTGPELLKAIDLLQAISWVSASWDEVEPTTISRCFDRCGFTFASSPAPADLDEAEDDYPLSVQRLAQELFGCQFMDLLQIDASMEASATATTSWDRPAGEILRELAEGEGEEEEEEEEEEEAQPSRPSQPSQPPTATEALLCLDQLDAFARHHGLADMITTLHQWQDSVTSRVARSAKQSKMTDFFKR